MAQGTYPEEAGTGGGAAAANVHKKSVAMTCRTRARQLAMTRSMSAFRLRLFTEDSTLWGIANQTRLRTEVKECPCTHLAGLGISFG